MANYQTRFSMMLFFATVCGGAAFALPSANLKTAAVQQVVQCSGVVKDALGEPIIGASIKIKGSSNGTITNINGEFQLSDLNRGAVLVVSYIGYQTQEVIWNGGNLDIVLMDDSHAINEVVVVGYGTQKKVNLTGSVSTVDTKALQARPVQNLAQALQGAVPGLNIDVNNAGGQLNGKLSMSIRGSGTIGEGSYSSPLVLIDGTECDFYSVAPSDIESISVLKDAASSAIYGSRAAFGVILITTKSGKTGRMNVTYNGNMRFSTATQIPEMLNSLDFARYWNDAAINSGEQRPFGDDMLEKIKNHMNGTPKPGDEIPTHWNGYAANEPWAMYTGSWANTDWFAEMYKKNVPSKEHNISVSGGTEKIKYYVSGAALNQNGLIRHGKDTFNRYNLSGKVTADVTDWLKLTYNTKWVREDYSRPSYMTGLFFHNIARRWPTNPIYDPHGHYVPGNEIIQMEEGGLDKNQKDYLYQQFIAELNPLEGLLVRLEANYNTTHNHNHWDVLPVYYHDPDQKLTPSAWSGGYAPGKSDLGESMDKTNYFNGRFYTEYHKLFNDVHDFKALAGMDMESNHYTYLGVQRADLITTKVPTLNNATNKNVRPGFSDNHWATMGFFARVNYAYDSRYLAEISIRRDGSSRFIGDKRWATFPSFSAGWNIANEKFFAPLQNHVQMLKLRGSWGSLGNTNIKALYPWFLSMPFKANGSSWILNGDRQNISSVPGLVSPDLTWESVRSWTVGLDFGLLNNRLQGSFDYFVRTTKNMVGPAPVKPSILGTEQPAVNNSDMRSNGWELELRWRDNIGEFSYGAKLVLSDDYQTITRYYNPNNLLSEWHEGQKLGDIWGYKVAGIAKTKEEMDAHLANNKHAWGSNWAAGDVMYKDLNGDKKVNGGKGTYDDPGDKTVIGNNRPRYRFGITLDAAYKGFDFSIFMQGIAKRDFWDDSPYSVGANVGMWQAAGFKEHLDYFRPADDTNLGPNLDGFYPRPLFGHGWKNFQVSDRYLQNAAYMRIKNLQIGYSLPQSVISKIGANRVRVYFSADNLVTFTKMSSIFDPEATGGDWGPGKIYPLQRTVSFGLNVNF